MARGVAIVAIWKREAERSVFYSASTHDTVTTYENAFDTEAAYTCDYLQLKIFFTFYSRYRIRFLPPAKAAPELPYHDTPAIWKRVAKRSVFYSASTHDTVTIHEKVFDTTAAYMYDYLQLKIFLMFYPRYRIHSEPHTNPSPCFYIATYQNPRYRIRSLPPAKAAPALPYRYTPAIWKRKRSAVYSIARVPKTP